MTGNRSYQELPPTADYETTKKLHATVDAKVWAQEWCRIAREIEASDDDREIIDEGWMIGWFANAIMVGYDEGVRSVVLEAVRRYDVPGGTSES